MEAVKCWQCPCPIHKDKLYLWTLRSHSVGQPCYCSGRSPIKDRLTTLLFHRFIYTVHILCVVFDSIWEVATVNTCFFASLPASSFDCIKRVGFNGNMYTRKTDTQENGSIPYGQNCAILKHFNQIVVFSEYIVWGGAPSSGSWSFHEERRLPAAASLPFQEIQMVMNVNSYTLCRSFQPL